LTPAVLSAAPSSFPIERTKSSFKKGLHSLIVNNKMFNQEEDKASSLMKSPLMKSRLKLMSAGTVKIEPEMPLILKLKSQYNPNKNMEIHKNSDIPRSNKDKFNSIENKKI